MIGGPAGIGKSGLLADLRARAGDRLLVLAARASELEREFGFGVVRQLFEATVADPARGAGGAAARRRPAASRVRRARRRATGVASFAALHGLFWLASNLAAEQPLLLAVDDLHWCDRPSLRFLAYLARRLEGAADPARRDACAAASRAPTRRCSRSSSTTRRRRRSSPAR